MPPVLVEPLAVIPAVSVSGYRNIDLERKTTSVILADGTSFVAVLRLPGSSSHTPQFAG